MSGWGNYGNPPKKLTNVLLIKCHHVDHHSPTQVAIPHFDEKTVCGNVSEYLPIH